MLAETVERWNEEWMEKCEAQLAEGERKGTAKAYINSINTVLAARFQDVPQEVYQQIDSTSSRAFEAT